MKLSSLLNQSLIFFSLEGADRSELYTNLLTKMSKIVKLPVPPAEAAKEMMDRVCHSDDYYKALRIISEYVETELTPHLAKGKKDRGEER